MKLVSNRRARAIEINGHKDLGQSPALLSTQREFSPGSSMSGRWHKLPESAVNQLGYSDKLIAYVFIMLNPTATVTEVQVGAGVSRRAAFAAYRERNGLRNKSGTETERAEWPPANITPESRNGNGTKAERFAERTTYQDLDLDPPIVPPPGDESALGFDRFWQAYPRRVGKTAALKAWARQHPDAKAVLIALDWQKQQEQWLRDGGQFIPHPSTYLNQRRWEDERPAVQEPTSNIKEALSVLRSTKR